MEGCPKCGREITRVSRTEIPGVVTRQIDRYHCRECKIIVEKEVKWTEVDCLVGGVGWSIPHPKSDAADVSTVSPAKGE